MFIAYKTNEDTIRVSPGVKNAIRVKMMRLDQKGKLGIRLILKEVWKIIEHVIQIYWAGARLRLVHPLLWQKTHL